MLQRSRGTPAAKTAQRAAFRTTGTMGFNEVAAPRPRKPKADLTGAILTGALQRSRGTPAAKTPLLIPAEAMLHVLQRSRGTPAAKTCVAPALRALKIGLLQRSRGTPAAKTRIRPRREPLHCASTKSRHPGRENRGCSRRPERPLLRFNEVAAPRPRKRGGRIRPRRCGSRASTKSRHPGRENSRTGEVHPIDGVPASTKSRHPGRENPERPEVDRRGYRGLQRSRGTPAAKTRRRGSSVRRA